MAKKYSRDEVIKHAKALGMPVPPNAATMSKSDYKDFTNNLNTFKAEEKHKTEPAKKEAKKYRDTTEGKNYVAKAKEVKKRAEAGGDTSGEYSIDDLPSSVIREIDKEIPLEAFDYTEGLLSQISQASPFVTGARSGGRMDYTTYGGSVKDNTDYVNTYPDLKRAWQEILNNPNSETARYWLPRMGVTDPADITIDRFGMAHQAENAKLGSDTYIGDTEVRPDGSRWDEWREGKDESGQRDPNSDYWKRSILDPDTGKPAVSTVDQEKAKANAAAARAASNAARMAGGSGEYLATPYTRPALQDWSDLAPPNMPGLLGSAKAQQDLLGSGLAAYQPWAQGGVLDYAPRGGSTWAPRTYSTNPLDNSAAVTNNNAVTNPLATDPNAWVGPGGQTDFMQFTQDNAERYYPGRFQAAQDEGVSGWRAFTPEGRKWTAEQPNTSAAWIAAQRAANDAGTRQVASNAVFNAGRGLLNPTPAGTDLATLIALEGSWHPGVK